MGLGVGVGFLADMKVRDEEGYEHAKSQIAKLRALLEGERLPVWEEPETLPSDLGMRPHVGSFSYGTIHYVRRVYAHEARRLRRGEGAPVAPLGAEGIDAHRSLIEAEMEMLDSHLLCHSDSAGWYVPVDFPMPLYALYTAKIAGGGIVGSSYGLKRELSSIAGAMGVTLENGELSDREAARVFEESTRSGPWSRELTGWLALYECARASIAHRTAIRFG